MSQTMSAMSKPQYRPSRRNWVKLWVNEWLTGTMRFQLSQEQRSLWADLLALAGASRMPGIICSGNTNGVLDGYPSDYLCGILRWNLEEFGKAIELFKEQGRISIDGAGVIYILNWQKYQSEYHQKRNRAADKGTNKKKFGKKSAAKSESVSEMSAESKPIGRPLEVEVEVEGDVEEEGEREQLARALFEKFWIIYPKKLDKDLAWQEWLHLSPIDWDRAVESVELWAKSEEWEDAKFVPAPVNFLKKRRFDSKPVQKVTKENLSAKAREMEANFEKGGH
jgi:replisome organiser protein